MALAETLSHITEKELFIEVKALQGNVDDFEFDFKEVLSKISKQNRKKQKVSNFSYFNLRLTDFFIKELAKQQKREAEKQHYP